MSEIYSGNSIRKNIISTYPGAVLYGLLFNITLMIDSIIAGGNLGAAGIEAVALGVPGYGVLAAVIYSFIHGSGLRMIWAVMFYIFSPVLSALCGMPLTSDIARGIIFCMIFTPFMHTVYMFTLYYEATKRFKLSIAFAIIPDSCLYLLMMAFLIPIIGR